MHWTSTDAARRRIIVVSIIAGPALLLLSTAFTVPEQPGGMRADFAAMAANPWLLLAESLLEAVGFAVALASYAGATRALRVRGGALGSWGAVLCMIGILGFTLSAAGGLFLYVVAQMPDADAGFAAGMALNADGVTGGVIMVLMFLGEAGICLVIGGLMRAHIVGFWPLVLVVVGIIADNVLPSIFSGLVADAALLAASVLVAIAIAKVPSDVWMGERTPAKQSRVAQPA